MSHECQLKDRLEIKLKRILLRRNTLPDGPEPYYLKADCAPAYYLNSQSCAPLIRHHNAHDHAFALSLISGIGSRAAFPAFTHARTAEAQGPFEAGRVKLPSHTLFRCIEGKVRFEVGAGSEEVSAGESVMVPAREAFSYVVVSAYARMYCFSGKGGGLEEVFVSVGRKGAKGEVVGANEDVVSREAVKEAVEALGGEVV